MTYPDPVTLAREVLDAAHQAALHEKSGSDDALMDQLDICADAAPDLARAVIDLTDERDAYREGVHAAP